MGFGKIAQNAVSTVTGEITKAVLCFKDERKLATGDLKKEKAEKASTGTGLPGNVSVGALKAYTPSVGKVIQNFVAGVAGGKPCATGYDYSIEVQFNPSSIRLQGNAGDDDVAAMNYSQTGRPGISRGAMRLHMQMSVDLIFDQESNLAAFRQDLLDLDAHNLATQGISAGISKGLSKLTGAQKVSVQQIVEAFIALMRIKYTRMVCFLWGDLKYEGMVRQVQNEYTMFDMFGNPIRARVRLSIVLFENTNGVLGDYTKGYWYQVYVSCFINNNPAAKAMLELAEADPTRKIWGS